MTISEKVLQAKNNDPFDPARKTFPSAGVVLPVVLTLLVQAVVSMSVVAIPVFMPVATRELNVPASYVGIFMSVIYLGSTMVAPVSGYFIDRFGPIGVSQICLVLCALGLVALSTPAIPLMIIGAFIMGIGHGPVTPASSHLLIRTTPFSMMSFVFSIKQTGVPLGGALAGAVFPTSSYSSTGKCRPCGWRHPTWRWPFSFTPIGNGLIRSSPLEPGYPGKR